MAAMYTEAQLITEVRTRLREPVAAFWSDTDIQHAIRRGARLLSGITLCTPIKESITTTNIMAHALSSKFLWIDTVTHIANGGTETGLQREDMLKFGNAIPYGTGPVQAFWHFGNSGGGTSYLYLWPPPYGNSLSANGATTYAYGYRTAYAYEYTDGTLQYDIPDALQPLLIEYALAECFTKDGKHAKAHGRYTKFLYEAGRHRIDVHDRELMVDSKDKTKVPDRSVSR